MERHSIIWRLKNYSNNSSDFIIFRVWGAPNGSGRVKRKWRPHLEKVVSRVDFFNNDHFFLFSRKTDKRYRPYSFCIVISANFCCIKGFSASSHVRWRHCHIWSMYLKFTRTGNGNDIIRHDWKLKKNLMQHKFAEIHDTKRIRSISLLSFF